MVEKRVSTEIRAKGRRLQGYASVFGVEARIGDFVEVIQNGAFSATLAANRDVLALSDHDPGKLLARTRSGTLKLSEDSKGLAFEIDVPQTTLGNDMLAMAERNDLGGMSFGFNVAKDGERWSGNRRTLTAVDLVEISVVSAWPAYPETSVSARGRTPRLNAARLFLGTVR